MDSRIIPCFVLLVFFATSTTRASSPFLTDAPFTPVNAIDRLLVAGLERRGMAPANRCSDEVFLRRIHLDLIGTLPKPKAVKAFLSDSTPDKRVRLINALMAREEFDDTWTLKWCDILRVKAEFPINLWPNGVQAYARWLHDAVHTNMPYDEFARALLTSNGSNFRVPPVNFYRAVQGETPAALAAVTALTFMGVRLASWPPARQDELATFFSRVAFKGTAEWKEVIVYPDPAQTSPMPLTYPDGTFSTLRAGADPREAFAAWLTSPDNPWFARAISNRAWSWFFGFGLIHEPDDIRPDNPAVHPDILAFLEQELVRNQYDLRHLFRLILSSCAYQQCSIPSKAHPDSIRWFAQYPTRQLDAEVLLDALCDISGQHDEYASAIPEPFTFVPPENRNIALTDGSITSPFLKMFGRPGRDSGLESERSRTPTKEQRLYMLNASRIHDKINRSWKIIGGGDKGHRDPGRMVEQMYLAVLSRFPTPEETTIARQHLEHARGRAGAGDLLWALLNSKEFLYRH